MRTVLDPHDANNPIPVHVGNWRTDNNALWCGDDPDCAYGNVALNKVCSQEGMNLLCMHSSAVLDGVRAPTCMSLVWGCLLTTVKYQEEAYANPSPLAIINDDYKEVRASQKAHMYACLCTRVHTISTSRNEHGKAWVRSE